MRPGLSSRSRIGEGRRSVEIAPCAGPSDGAASGAGNDELLQALDLERAGISQSAIAAVLLGADALTGGWYDTSAKAAPAT